LKTHDVVLPFPVPVKPVRRVRSTVFVGSIAALRDRGLFDRYASKLDPAHHTLLDVVPGVWLPIEPSCAHYEACQALGVTADVAAKLGAYNFERVGKSLFGTVLDLAKGVGVTPWTMLSQIDRFWKRGYDGGGLRVTRLGPKEALLELQQSALVDIEFYRHSLRGFVESMIGGFCSRAYARAPAGVRAPGTYALLLQWA
jgi:hypothetical protein